MPAVKCELVFAHAPITAAIALKAVNWRVPCAGSHCPKVVARENMHAVSRIVRLPLAFAVVNVLATKRVIVRAEFANKGVCSKAAIPDDTARVSVRAS